MSDLLTKKKFSSPLDQAFVAANWRQRGYSCNQFVDPPGQEWLNFTHETDELAAVVEGQLELTIGSETKWCITVSYTIFWDYNFGTNQKN